MKTYLKFLILILTLSFITIPAYAAKDESNSLPVHVGQETSSHGAALEEEWDPYDDMLRMRSRIHQVFDDGFWRAMQAPGQLGYSFQRALKQPAMDILETDDNIILRLDLPGVEKNDIKIEVKNNVLSVRGKRSTITEQTKEEEGAHYYHRERVVGTFQRHVQLPENANADEISAEQKDGILTIKIPKTEQVKPVTIEVK